MKTKEVILEHLAETIYTHKARTAIKYWLIGKGIIDETDEVKYATHIWDSVGRKKTEGKTFEDFKEWVERCSLTDMIEETLKYFEDAIGSWPKVYKNFTDDERPDEEKIKVGDYVQVIDDNPREEYVEFVHYTDEDDDNQYLGLSDGTWVCSSDCHKFKIQGEERLEMKVKLKETY